MARVFFIVLPPDTKSTFVLGNLILEIKTEAHIRSAILLFIVVVII